MGNQCCNTAGSQLGFNFTQNTLNPLKLLIDNPSTSNDEAKKSMNIYSQAVAARQAKLSNDTKKIPKNLEVKINSQRVTPSPISCPLPTNSQPRAINDGLNPCPLTQQNQEFLYEYGTLTKTILETIVPEKSLLNMNQWKTVLQPLDGIYLTVTDRIQLMKSLYYLIKVQFGLQFNQQEKQQNLLQEDYCINEQEFCQEISHKLTKVKKRVKNRKSQTIEIFSFMRSFSSYQTDLTDFKKVAKRAYQLCKKDINAFSFVTLYLYSSINAQLEKNPRNVFQMMELLKNIINQLSAIYPPNSLEVQQQEEQQGEEEIHNTNYETCIRYPMIDFESQDSILKTETVQNEIIRMAKSAKKNKLKFDQILKPVCLKKGKCFESALKIKTTNQEDTLSQFRVYQKIVFKQQTQQFHKWVEQQKPGIVEELAQSQQYNKIMIFNASWGDVVQQLQQQMLKGKKRVPFCVADLLRGKALFKSKSHIYKTVKLIQEKFQSLDSTKYAILQTQNRLDKPTKDFKIIFLIQDTIAQLQLAMEMSKQQNQFNHKIYELKRAKGFSPFMTLWMINEHLSETFFDDQLELCYFMIQRKDETFMAGKHDLEAFEQTVLSKNVTAYSISEDYLSQDEERFFTDDRQTKLANVQVTFANIDNLLKDGYNPTRIFDRDQIRKKNNQIFIK